MLIVRSLGKNRGYHTLAFLYKSRQVLAKSRHLLDRMTTSCGGNQGTPNGFGGASKLQRLRLLRGGGCVCAWGTACI